MPEMPTPTRVRSSHLAALIDRLSARDWTIIATVNRLHLVTGPQLERLHFPELASPRARTVSRSRALARLVAGRVLVPLPRRVGGSHQGSGQSVYALDTAGQRLLRQRDDLTADARIRVPGAPNPRWVAHILAVAEVYTQLVEADRSGQLHLRDFRAEPAAWWPDGLGSHLKPDAYAVISNGRVDHLWWIEVDLATESLPTIRRKLCTYLDFVERGSVGPRRTIPRVLLAVPDDGRRRAIAGMIGHLPPLATELLRIETQLKAVPALAGLLPPADPVTG